MNHSTLTTKESIDNRLIEEISQLQQFSLGEGAAVCEVCGDKLREGAPIVVFVFRPADQTAFQVGHVKCVDCRHEPTEYFTLGVRELVLEGRVGTCSDPATQSSWQVLLAPQPRVSESGATPRCNPCRVWRGSDARSRGAMRSLLRIALRRVSRGSDRWCRLTTRTTRVRPSSDRSQRVTT